MKTIKTLITAASIAALASTASAAVYNYQINPNNPIDFLRSSDSSPVTRTFTDLLSGVDLTEYEVVSAILTLGFSDTEWKDWSWQTDGTDEYALVKVEGTQIDLGGDQNSNGATEVDGSHINNNFEYFSKALGSTDIDSIEANKNLEFSVEAQAADNANYGDFYLKKAELEITTRKIPTSQVPDTGATAMLLAFSLAGLAAARRRFVK